MNHALIIGGGIGGAVTAMALQKTGIDSTVYEAYPTGADDVGAFLNIMGNGLDALRAIDAHQPVLDNSFPANSVEFVSGTGKQLGAVPIGGAEVGVLGPLPSAPRRGSTPRHPASPRQTAHRRHQHTRGSHCRSLR